MRVNAIGTPWCHLDLAALAASGRDAADGRAPEGRAARTTSRSPTGCSRAPRPPAGRATPVRLLALIETAAGLAAAAEIARASERLDGLVLGYADLAASLGRPARGAPQDWRFAQESVLVAARAAGIQAIDGPHLGTRDDDAFRAGVLHARTLGFDGKWAIHPAQLDALREAFTPDRRRDRRRARGARRARRAPPPTAPAPSRPATGCSTRRSRCRRGACWRAPAPGPMSVAVGSAVALRPGSRTCRSGPCSTAAPALTLTEGHAALHQAIAGDRLRLALDRTLGEAVLGAGAPVAHPALVWDAAIGQSTVATGRVVANLFYRGLLLRRAVRLGDTLRTTTEVVARRENRVKEGRRPTGLALLRIRTVDQEDRPGARLHALRDAAAARRARPASRGDEVGGAADLDAEPLRAAADGLDLAAYRAAVPGPHFDDVAGRLGGGDRGRRRGRLRARARAADAQRRDGPPRRQLDRPTAAGSSTAGTRSGSPPAQATRALPALVTILGWHACDHTAPVFEGDTLRSRIELERREPLPGGGGLLHLRSRVTAARADGGEDAEVLDWRFVAVLA